VVKILSACFDAGPANNVGPVVQVLRQRGVEVISYAVGPATDALAKAGIEFLPYTTAEEALDSCGEIDLFYGAIDCNDRLPSLEVVREMKRRGITCPVNLQTDFWGSGIYKKDDWSTIVPTGVFCNDKLDAELAHITFPRMPISDTFIEGWPYLDGYNCELTEIDALGKRTREGLAIGSDETVVLFAGQLNRTGEVFAELVAGIIEANQPVTLIARQHPAMLLERDKDGKWEHEREEWKVACASFARWDKGKYLDCTGPAYNVRDLIAASDLITGAFTTTLIESAAWRKQNLALLFPKTGMQEWLDVTKGLMGGFPLCELGACGYADSLDELTRLLSLGYSGKLGEQLMPNQIEHIKANGGNAERIADEIMRQFM